MATQIFGPDHLLWTGARRSGTAPPRVLSASLGHSEIRFLGTSRFESRMDYVWLLGLECFIKVYASPLSAEDTTSSVVGAGA